MTSFRSRSGANPPPEQRPIKARSAVRVLLTAADQVLLFADTDPGVPGSRWWLTPGGGVDPGESLLQAAVRELGEETGRRVEPEVLAGPVLRRFVIHGFSDQVTGQAEHFFWLDLPAPFELDTSGFTADELLTISDWRWWSRDELATTEDSIWPIDLLAVLAGLEHPNNWPVDAGVVEESVVGAGKLARRAALQWAGF